MNVGFVIEESVADELFHVSGASDKAWDAVDDVADEMETIEIVQHDHVEGSSRRSFFFVAANVEVFVIRAAIGETMNEPGITVVGEDDRFVFGEECVEI